MGLFDILRGQRTPKRANLESLFAVSTAYPTLSVNLEMSSTGRAGVCFKSIEAGDFTALVAELDELLAISGSDTGTEISRHEDEMGFLWVVLTDEHFDDLVTTTHLVNQSIGERGYGEKLLCSVFGFRTAEGEPVDLVYAYKRGSFYPFAPRSGRRRDNALELRLQAALAGEMPMEPELERWYPVWDAPVADQA